MLLTKKIKLEVSEQDTATLEFMQAKCRGLYNWWIGCLRNGEKWPGWKEAKATLQESKHYDPELRQVYGKLLAEVYFRLEKAMRDFYRRCQERKEGQKPGFPRFKPDHEFFTLCYPAMYIKREDDKLNRCQKGSRRYKHLSGVYKRVSEKKRHKQHDSLHKASHLISHKLVESTVVVGDLSQRQMVMKEQNRHKNRTCSMSGGAIPSCKCCSTNASCTGRT